MPSDAGLAAVSFPSASMIVKMLVTAAPVATRSSPTGVGFRMNPFMDETDPGPMVQRRTRGFTMIRRVENNDRSMKP